MDQQWTAQGDAQQDAMNAAPPPESEAVDHVVAIGASAGGLEALESLFDHLPAATGAAFVVITHLSPDFKSIMDELLARRTEMPVHVVEDGEPLEANRVYVIPPGKDMIVQAGRLLLTDREGHGAPSAPIDLFFGSLAQAFGRRATGVILSGTGADGARGAKALRAAGGYVIAQTLETARFDGMPRAVAEIGAVDAALAPEAIGPALAARLARLDAAAPEIAAAGDAGAVSRILERVLGGANVDFSEYKKTTVLRRIARRMQSAGLHKLEDYHDELARSPAEVRALADDLLIVVTEFFRDPAAFDLLAQTVIPALLSGDAERAVRIWIPAVGTGQEAYSIAMLLREAADALGREPRVQIFATDISPAALERAAAGVYTETEMAGVAPARRAAFFERNDEGDWRVGPEIRNWIVFAQHNMLRDPPFINTNLISCRNALIYLEPSAQSKALSLFHFSLSSGGFLLLGPSESVGEDNGRFAAIDARWRLFRKRGADRRDAGAMGELIASGRWAADGLARRRATAPAGPTRGANAAALQAVLELFAPAGLLIGRDRELLHVVGDGQRYLAPPQPGPFTRDVLKLIRPGLRAALSTAIERTLRTGAGASYAAGEGSETLTLSAHPVQGLDGVADRVFIAFGPAPAGAAPGVAEPLDKAAEQRIAWLEDALRAERENLQAMLEQLETANEELQSTNEELMTANEELQSTNEELHSVNEELYTVNAEYERKNEELTQLTKDVSGLLQATGVGVVFVDRALNVRRFTATATRVVNLIQGDEGRHLSHITHQLAGFDLCGWLESAMERGAMQEEERCATDGAVWMVRAAPVRDGRTVSGAVVSLIEVSRLVAAEADARARGAELRQLLDWVGAVSLQFSADGRLVGGSGDWRAFTGQDVAALRGADGDGWLEIVHPDDAGAVAAEWGAAHAEGRAFQLSARLRRPEGGWRPVTLAGGPERDGVRLMGWFVYARDAAEAAQARHDADLSGQRAAALAEMAFAGAYTLDPAAGVIDLDARLAALTGLAAGPQPVADFEARLSPASRRARASALARCGADGRWSADVSLTRADGRTALFRDAGVAKGAGLIGALTPLDGPAADAALAEEILRSSPVEVAVLDPDSLRILRANPAAMNNLGLSARDMTRLSYPDLLPEYDAAAFAALIAPLLAGARAEVRVETFALRRDGGTYDLSLTLRPMAGGARIAAVGRDMTERHGVEEALRRRTEALARSNRDLEQFAFLAGHDLIAPLGRIAARARAGLAGDAPAALEAVAARAERLQAQVRDLLAFARSAPPETAFAPVDLTAVAQAAAAHSADEAARLGGRIEVGALPVVEGSAHTLELVFRNLIENALRYRAEDRAPVVRVFAGEGDAPAVAVADNGRGFDPARARDLFAPGLRLDDGGEGFGMGLAICRRVMEAHGGDIRAESAPGEGATFLLSFGGVKR